MADLSNAKIYVERALEDLENATEHMTLPWYRSCPHGCFDPETCPYRNHLEKIRALLQELREKDEELRDLKLNVSQQRSV